MASGWMSRPIRHDVEELVKTFDVVCPGTASMSGMLSGGNIQKMIAAREFTSGAPGHCSEPAHPRY